MKSSESGCLQYMPFEERSRFYSSNIGGTHRLEMWLPYSNCPRLRTEYRGKYLSNRVNKNRRHLHKFVDTVNFRTSVLERDLSSPKFCAVSDGIRLCRHQRRSRIKMKTGRLRTMPTATSNGTAAQNDNGYQESDHLFVFCVKSFMPEF